jgi:hypothetical protein
MHLCDFCNNHYLLPLFYGITFVSLFTRWYTFPLLYIYVFLLTLVEWIKLSVLEAFVYTSFGLLAGICVKYIAHTTRILPKNLLKHHHILLIYLFELLLAPFIIFRIDTVIAHTGYPIGVTMSLVFYVGWFLLAYNINFRHEGMLSQPDVDVALYNQTYLHWFYALLPFYATALLSIHVIAKIGIGLFLLCVLLFIERHVTGPLTARSWPKHEL